ncbi:hypothetical protein ACFYU8_17855 [Brevibacillus sp. NPDC003359]|uniref:hypothetical protein n=1 Tax=unclassified Brevibacillus TaxID=2684853 RepID=UPI0036CEC419
MNLKRLHDFLEDKEVPDNEVQGTNTQLKLVEIVTEFAQSERMTFEDVDFKSFNLNDAQTVLDHLVYYVADEGSNEPDEDNRTNLWLELNRIAHVYQLVEKVEPIKNKKSLFV